MLAEDAECGRIMRKNGPGGIKGGSGHLRLIGNHRFARGTFFELKGSVEQKHPAGLGEITRVDAVKVNPGTNRFPKIIPSTPPNRLVARLLHALNKGSYLSSKNIVDGKRYLRSLGKIIPQCGGWVEGTGVVRQKGVFHRHLSKDLLHRNRRLNAAIDSTTVSSRKNLPTKVNAEICGKTVRINLGPTVPAVCRAEYPR